MKRNLLMIVCLLFAFAVPVMAQHPTGPVSPEQEEGENLVVIDGQVKKLDVPPTFKKKGFDKYCKWVQARVDYPSDMEQERVEGFVLVRIIVETDGTVTIGEVVRSPHEHLTEAVVKVIEESPLWTPGKIRNPDTGELEAIRVSYVIPVEFKLPPLELNQSDASRGRFLSKPDLKPYGSGN
ncbi:MAG TPA: energy transducer TonB [Candidatus Alistipes avicola]|uniref:Energy transducer TonB n=1 Tax=Candidatus Alistipes avicola TaxID=2838432 RepID=A0A9D2IDD8_9BACT|nr:TonB family protein [uncultured Alistipes sp.]HJA98726.1 energy transducer TonB [Candidatus Alistipes avicola]